MNDPFSELAVLPACAEDINILHEDASFLIINKPTRLLSVPGRHPQNRDSVITRLLLEYDDVAIVHRLDFDTSGVMVVPRGKAALSHISKQFQARTVHKTYTAVVTGLIAEAGGIIDLPIAADQENRPKYKICRQTGKASVTEFTVLSRDETTDTTRVLLHPITGRSHQLRLHMQAIGHAILGCEFYADAAALKKSSRLLLHATELAFDHPVTNERCHWICAADF